VRDGEVLAGADVDAVYRIASMTKSFTAASVVMLRDAGLLALDEPIERYAPEFAVLRSPLPSERRLDEETENDRKLNALLFAPQDYAVIGRVPEAAIDPVPETGAKRGPAASGKP